MTGVISDDALRGQQTRIINAMRAAAPKPGRDLLDISQALTSQSTGKGNYFETMNQLQNQRGQANVNAEVGIYNQMKEMAAQGDADAMAVNKAVDDVAGGDPKIANALTESLHNDPQPVNRLNASQIVMKHAAKLGITPLSVQKEKASINKLNADALHATRGGDKTAAEKEFDRLQKMNEEDRKLWFRNKRATGEDELDKTLGKEGGKEYGALQKKIQDTQSFLINTETAREALAKVKAGGPIFGRVGKAASDPDYVNWNSAKNGLALLAKSIYDMPNNNFSEGDREFLVDIVGGKFPRKEAAERVIDRLDLLATRTLRNAQKNQQNILDRKTYNRDQPVEDIPAGGKVTSKRIKFSDLPE